MGMLAGLLAGCSAPAEPTQPTLARVTAETPEAYDRLWEAAEDTLRQHYFDIDRRDRLQGVITTFPETSAHFFELWRPQPEPAYYWAEANLHTIPREVQVTIRPVDEAGTYEMAVEVERYRYSLTERQVDNSAAVLRLFSAEAPTTSGRLERPSETAQLIPLGRDAYLEERLVEAILKRYAEQLARAQPVEETIIVEEQTVTTRPG